MTTENNPKIKVTAKNKSLPKISPKSTFYSKKTPDGEIIFSASDEGAEAYINLKGGENYKNTLGRVQVERIVKEIAKTIEEKTDWEDLKLRTTLTGAKGIPYFNADPHEPEKITGDKETATITIKNKNFEGIEKELTRILP